MKKREMTEDELRLLGDAREAILIRTFRESAHFPNECSRIIFRSRQRDAMKQMAIHIATLERRLAHLSGLKGRKAIDDRVPLAVEIELMKRARRRIMDMNCGWKPTVDWHGIYRKRMRCTYNNRMGNLDMVLMEDCSHVPSWRVTISESTQSAMPSISFFTGCLDREAAVVVGCNMIADCLEKLAQNIGGKVR